MQAPKKTLRRSSRMIVAGGKLAAIVFFAVALVVTAQAIWHGELSALDSFLVLIELAGIALLLPDVVRTWLLREGAGREEHEREVEEVDKFTSRLPFLVALAVGFVAFLVLLAILGRIFLK